MLRHFAKLDDATLVFELRDQSGRGGVKRKDTIMATVLHAVKASTHNLGLGPEFCLDFKASKLGLPDKIQGAQFIMNFRYTTSNFVV